MTDGCGRTIDYLRLSVTDRCNYRCRYCMPEEGVCKREHREMLTLEELAEVAAACVGCGVRKIRLTGGEPLVREDLTELAAYAVEKGMRAVISTNGTLITKEKARELKAVIARVPLMPTSQSASERQIAASANGSISASLLRCSNPSRIAPAVID